MFYDYVLITSFILSSIIIALTAYIYHSIQKHLSAKTKQYQILQKKQKNYLNILYFFLLSIFLTRLIFCAAFPMQLDHLGIVSKGNSLSIIYLLYQAMAAIIYLLFIFLLQLNHHIKLTHKYEYLLKVLKFSLYFIGIDLILSLAGWFGYNFDLLFPAVLLNGKGAVAVPNAIVGGLIAGFILVSVLFWFLQRKRRALVRILFVLVMFITSAAALYVSFLNAGFYWPASNAFALFTYNEAAYGWMWFVLMISAIGSQIVAGIMLRLKEQFINRYFAINYTLQLNRITFIAVFGLCINALLPQIIIWLV